MHASLEARLYHWAVCIVKINCGESGYPSKSTLYEIYRMGGYVGKTTPKSTCLLKMSHWADEMNGVINRMKEKHPAWSEAIYLSYTSGLNKKAIAEKLGIATRTFRERVQHGMEWIEREIENNS